MRSIEIPELSFCPWVAWEDRRAIENSKYPGVYLISISEMNLVGVSPVYKEVSYIGMTNSQGGLRGRWSQFHSSIHGRKGHSGGNTVFEDLGNYRTWDKNLFVSGMSILCNTKTPDHSDLIKMGWVAYLEYEAFSAFYLSDSILKKPRYNKK